MCEANLVAAILYLVFTLFVVAGVCLAIDGHERRDADDVGLGFAICIMSFVCLILLAILGSGVLS